MTCCEQTSCAGHARHENAGRKACANKDHFQAHVKMSMAPGDKAWLWKGSRASFSAQAFRLGLPLCAACQHSLAAEKNVNIAYLNVTLLRCTSPRNYAAQRILASCFTARLHSLAAKHNIALLPRAFHHSLAAQRIST